MVSIRFQVSFRFCFGFERHLDSNLILRDFSIQAQFCVIFRTRFDFEGFFIQTRFQVSFRFKFKLLWASNSCSGLRTRLKVLKLYEWFFFSDFILSDFSIQTRYCVIFQFSVILWLTHKFEWAFDANSYFE